MRNLLIVFSLLLVLGSCKKNKVDPDENLTSSQLLSRNAWKLDRYTDTSGKTISDGNLNASAIVLYQMLFEFRENQETRAIEKVSKTVINRGTWNLLEDNKVLDINIVGFQGKFKIVVLQKGKLTLQASTGNFLSGVGSELNMEFSESPN
ncbi:MAG: hypothetical protein U0V04_10930 [Spirosomataceae bacterium]|jgi:hypothetical protein